LNEEIRENVLVTGDGQSVDNNPVRDAIVPLSPRESGRGSIGKMGDRRRERKRRGGRGWDKCLNTGIFKKFHASTNEACTKYLTFIFK